MSTQIFALTNLNELLSHFSAVNVTDPVPNEAGAFLQQVYPGSVFVTGAKLTQAMIKAVAANTMDALRRKYCEAPFLIIQIDKDDAIKTTLQQELVFWLNVRQYKKLPTILLSEVKLSEYPLTNESLMGYALIYNSILLSRMPSSA